jgi:hypothetical protein
MSPATERHGRRRRRRTPPAAPRLRRRRAGITSASNRATTGGASGRTGRRTAGTAPRTAARARRPQQARLQRVGVDHLERQQRAVSRVAAAGWATRRGSGRRWRGPSDAARTVRSPRRRRATASPAKRPSGDHHEATTGSSVSRVTRRSPRRAGRPARRRAGWAPRRSGSPAARGPGRQASAACPRWGSERVKSPAAGRSGFGVTTTRRFAGRGRRVRHVAFGRRQGRRLERARVGQRVAHVEASTPLTRPGARRP